MVFPTSGFSLADETLAIAKEHHRGIVEAITKRQGTRAEHLAREHAVIARRILAMALSDSEAFGKIPGASLIDLSSKAGGIARP
jgi:GntR family transcriptional regulator, vanillate catabolism transcriptional regulator